MQDVGTSKNRKNIVLLVYVLCTIYYLSRPTYVLFRFSLTYIPTYYLPKNRTSFMDVPLPIFLRFERYQIFIFLASNFNCRKLNLHFLSYLAHSTDKFGLNRERSYSDVHNLQVQFKTLLRQKSSDGSCEARCV